MQKIKDLRNHAKAMGIKITFLKDGKRKYYTKKQLLDRMGKHTQGGSIYTPGVQGPFLPPPEIHTLSFADMKAGSMKKGKKHHKRRGGGLTSDQIGDIGDLVSLGVDAVAPELAPFVPLITDIAKQFGEVSETEYNPNYQLSAQDIAYIRANPEAAMQKMQSNPYMANLMEQYFAAVGQQAQEQQEDTKTKGGKLIGLALPPQYQKGGKLKKKHSKKMTAGALHAKHQRVKEVLKHIEEKVMKPYLEKFYK